MATAPDLPVPPGWLPTNEAAAYLGTAPRYLRKLQQEKHLLHPRKFAGRLLWSIEELDAYKAAHARIGTRRQEVAA